MAKTSGGWWAVTDNKLPLLLLSGKKRILEFFLFVFPTETEIIKIE